MNINNLAIYSGDNISNGSLGKMTWVSGQLSMATCQEECENGEKGGFQLAWRKTICFKTKIRFGVKDVVVEG